MDTSKKYYEDKIRDFNRFRRGRTLAQFCRDEGIDCEWMQKAKRNYSGRDRQSEPDVSEDEDSLPPLIGLHYEDDDESLPKEESRAVGGGWRVGTVILTDPEGNEITISCGSVAALGSLLTKLAECHA